MRRRVRQESSRGRILGPGGSVVRKREEGNEARQDPDLCRHGEESPLTPLDRCVGDETHGKDTTDMGRDSEQIGIESIEAIVSEVERKVLTSVNLQSRSQIVRLTLSTASLDISHVRP